MEIKNYTPHKINIFDGGEEIETVEPSGQTARVEMEEIDGEPVDGIPVTKSEPGEVVGLPEPEEGAIVIVSGMVEAQTTRPDVYSPGPLVRDDEGKPVGCEGLKQTPPKIVHVHADTDFVAVDPAPPEGVEIQFHTP